MMKLLIEKLNGDVIDLEQYGVFMTDFLPASLEYEHAFSVIQGRAGNIDNGSTYGPRTIKARFYMKAPSVETYAMARDRVYKLLNSIEPYYIIESRTPWKRRRVKLNAPFSMDQTRMYGFFEVEWVTVGIPFAESRLTSTESKEWQDSGWSWGSGIQWGESMNVFDTTSFTVHNAGDVEVNPIYAMLDVEYVGASSNLYIVNNTNGSNSRYSLTSDSNDVIRFSGIRATKNGESIIADSNRRLIRLEPGDNNFTVTGTSGPFTLSFDFRYLYV